MNWQDKKEVQKGNIGEQIVRGLFEKSGFIVYTPETVGPHGSDFFCLKRKQKLIMGEVKTKAKRNFYPDTGINLSAYNTYKDLGKRYNMPVWLIFVDEMLGKIYGNELEKLSEFHLEGGRYYPLVAPGKTPIIYFGYPGNFIELATLSPAQIEQIKEHSNRKYNYAI